MLRKIIICVANAMVLILFHLFYFNSTWNLTMESEMVLKLTKMENFFGGEGRYRVEDFLFVNTSNDIMLIESAEADLPGNEAITDRSKLAALFKEIAERGNPHRYILCDILFDLPSPTDYELAVQMNRLDKIILPSKYDQKKNKMVRPVFKQHHGLADYITYDGKVSKMMLWSDKFCQKTLPMKMYEEISGRLSEKRWPGLWGNGSYIPYTIYPRYFFRETTIEKQRIGLGSLLDSLSKQPESFQHLIRNKIIVIGNFSSDSHPTAIGFMPGSLILLNTFMTIEEGYHYHHKWWFIVMLIAFAGISYYKLYEKNTNPEKKNRWGAAGNVLRLSVIVILLSMISFFLFNIHTTVIPVVVYFQGIRLFSKYFKSSV